MLIGYTRVSTIEQNAQLQKDALKAIGCGKFFHDDASGIKQNRPGLAAALEYARDGDVLVVWRLDRLGRSLADLLAIIAKLEAAGIGFKSVTEAIDTTTSGGKMIFQVFGAMAEFERNLIRERTQAGLKSARARGRFGGRPKMLDENQIQLAKQLYAEKNYSIKEICKLIGVTKPCLYNYIKDKHKSKAKIMEN